MQTLSVPPSDSLSLPSRPFFSFGITTKLVLAMTLMVTLACTSTVWFVDLEVKRTYQYFCKQQFHSEWQFFLTQEAARLSEARAILQEVLQRMPKETIRELVNRSEFESALSESMLKTLAEYGYPSNGLASNEPFFCWISESHSLYKPVKTNKGYGMQIQPDALEHPLDFLAQVKAERVAYLILQTAAGPFLYQLIAMPFPDKAKLDGVGDIVLGFPLKNFEELFGSHIRGEKSGIILASQLKKNFGLPTEGAQGTQDILKSIKLKDNVTLEGDDGHIMLNQDETLYYRKVETQAAAEAIYQLALFSLEDMRSFRMRMRWAILGIIPLVPLSGFFLSIMASRHMTRRVRRLAVANQRVGAGDYTVRVPEDNGDEISDLSRCFNQMVADLALKDKYRNILDQLADKEIAQRLLQGEIQLDGEQRDVSILFCDVRGFTHLAEFMAADKLLALLNEHMSALAEIAHIHNGVVDKFIGDAIMVIFGSPRSYGNDALNAAQAALDMQIKRAHLNQVCEIPIEIGIGIASGIVVAGCIGSAERLNYTVVGNRVNLASRLCDKAAAGEVLIDEATKARLGAAGVVELLPSILLKGMSEPMPVFKLNQVRGSIAGK